jgi:hypothetical protein
MAHPSRRAERTPEILARLSQVSSNNLESLNPAFVCSIINTR